MLEALHGLVRVPLLVARDSFPVLAFDSRGGKRFASFGEGARKLGALGLGRPQRLPYPRDLIGVRALSGLEPLTFRRERLARLAHFPGPMVFDGVLTVAKPAALRLEPLPGRLQPMGAVAGVAAGGLELLGEARAVALHVPESRMIGPVPVVRPSDLLIVERHWSPLRSG